jgi:1,2-diacylglycerol-3-alpha-glucose alpha-1,2-glucosyltransferase
MLSIPREIRKIVKKDHPENVLFPGYINGDLIEGAYSGADLFFFPSYEETEGIVVLEALASHQNVLVRDIPVYKGWLSNGHNAYMEKTNQGFIEKIKGIVDGTLPQLSEAGYETAKQKSIDEIGYELKEVYTKVMNTE